MKAWILLLVCLLFAGSAYCFPAAEMVKPETQPHPRMQQQQQGTQPQPQQTTILRLQPQSIPFNQPTQQQLQQLQLLTPQTAQLQNQQFQQSQQSPSLLELQHQVTRQQQLARQQQQQQQPVQFLELQPTQPSPSCGSNTINIVFHVNGGDVRGGQLPDSGIDSFAAGTFNLADPAADQLRVETGKK